MYRSKEQSLKLIHEKYNSLWHSLNEKSRRLWAASEAKAYGYGGITLVSEAIGISNKTIHKGLKELSNSVDSKIRKKGGVATLNRTVF